MIGIVLVDEDRELHEFLKLVFPKEFKLFSAYSGHEGIIKCSESFPEIVLLDIDLHDCDGFDVLTSIKSSTNSPSVIVYSAQSAPPYVVKAMKLGASDFLHKPQSMYELKNVLFQAITSRSIMYDKIDDEVDIPELRTFIGRSKLIQKVKYCILKYAKSDSALLITGESGTGKDVVAEIVHSLSTRKNGPYVALNCGAIPGTILESELFGSNRGAFTDAVNKPGSFELANGGTLFLDEIGEMEIHSQVKLLRVIEKKQVVHVGGIRNIPVDVRIIAATNSDLEKALKNRTFREDLFYRINTLTVHIPPLRERKEDIPLLVDHFLSKHDIDYYISPLGMEKLLDHRWPGNVRELKNVLERSILFAEDNTIVPDNIQFNRYF